MERRAVKKGVSRKGRNKWAKNNIFTNQNKKKQRGKRGWEKNEIHLGKKIERQRIKKKTSSALPSGRVREKRQEPGVQLRRRNGCQRGRSNIIVAKQLEVGVGSGGGLDGIATLIFPQ